MIFDTSHMTFNIEYNSLGSDNVMRESSKSVTKLNTEHGWHISYFVFKNIKMIIILQKFSYILFFSFTQY